MTAVAIFLYLVGYWLAYRVLEIHYPSKWKATSFFTAAFWPLICLAEILGFAFLRKGSKK